MKYNLDSYNNDIIENNESKFQTIKRCSKNFIDDEMNRDIEFPSKCIKSFDDEISLFKTETTCIGLDKTFRNEKSLNLSISNEIDNPKNHFSNESGDFLANNSSEATIISSFEEILTKNSKNFQKYKTEGCLVIYDEIETKTPYMIDFAELLNFLSDDSSNSENFIGVNTGKWVDEFEKNISDNENGIAFDSRFESGNLRMAIKVNENEYDLILRKDTNSEKTSNWFFFELKVWCQKIFDCKRIKINIINLQKKESLFSKCLKILKYSAQSKKWMRDTYDVHYFINGMIVNEKNLYTLTFTFDLQEGDENIDLNEDIHNNNKISHTELESCKFNNCHYPKYFYFAYCYPYTYTALTSYLIKISKQEHTQNILRIETLGKSLCNNNLFILKITNFKSKPSDIDSRPAVILTARIHPGESNSSIVIQGVIDYLLQPNHSIAKELRDKYIFQIVPMLNPDGVINGNYRSCVNGRDLNRMWVDPRENMCPTLFYTKEMIRTTLAKRKIFLFCDFHGHSNKNNFFLFCCPLIGENEIKTEKESILLQALSKLNDSFDLNSCIYKISKNKIKTARAVMKNEFNIKYSYCLESSIGGITIGERNNKYYTIEDYLKIGRDFCQSLWELSIKDNNQGSVDSQISGKGKGDLKKKKSNEKNSSKNKENVGSKAKNKASKTTKLHGEKNVLKTKVLSSFSINSLDFKQNQIQENNYYNKETSNNNLSNEKNLNYKIKENKPTKSLAEIKKLIKLESNSKVKK